ncbi:hypothetical protein FIBSPDRAFT_369337 [Athelia psychrophila]|uniref:Uncharacterized protein n=1 Tax=Athelia psychrophila TaxID=1759441 RepID=A0A166PA57_9AGAM|nr:hypothetical protein FIBSPDRAFT_369337 [Fibularhizoctonia sp. CBS 109695]
MAVVPFGAVIPQVLTDSCPSSYLTFGVSFLREPVSFTSPFHCSSSLLGRSVLVKQKCNHIQTHRVRGSEYSLIPCISHYTPATTVDGVSH